MDILPEGKVQISSSANLKDRIDGIQFSSQGYEVWITKVVDEKDQKKTEEVLDSTVQRLVKEYYDKLAKEITTTRNELIDTLRAELSTEYDEKLKKAKEIILKQREEIKLLKSK